MHSTIVNWLTSATGLPWIASVVPGPLAVYVIAAAAGQIIFLRRAHTERLSPWKSALVALAIAIGSLAGARLLYVLQQTALGHRGLSGGLSTHGSASFGAYIGAAILMGSASALLRLPICQVSDIAMSTLGIVVCIGRLSCFLAGDDFGAVSEGPLAVRYPPGSLPFEAQVHQGILDLSAQASLPVHPVQLYLSAIGLILFVLTSWGWRRWKHRPGLTTYSYWTAYCPARFLLEFLRGDQPHLGTSGLTPPQALSLLVLIPVAIGLVVTLRSRPGRTPVT
jgi:phosphatidylglycerol---prolipoprotein diacylglyceryl transferase